MRKEEMLELIKKADEAYYMEDNPIMTDAEYDKLRYDFIIDKDPHFLAMRSSR